MADGRRFASQHEVVQRLRVDREWLSKLKGQFPVKWPAYYLDLVRDPDGPIALMGRPTPAEWQEDVNDLRDPVGDHLKRELPFVVRKHRDRVILLVTKACHFYCRFCFRRDEPPSGGLTIGQWEQVFSYLRAHPEIEEAILSGGDPLTLSDAKLSWIGRHLHHETPIRRWRIHTRAPVHFPSRVTPKLVRGLVGLMPLRWITHFNHADEIGPETWRIAQLLASCGVGLLNQAVLLHRVNDSVEAQVDLWEGLGDLGIEGHYLHHPDRVAGNAGFRVTLEDGLRIHQTSLQRTTRCPPYVIDLPDGSGKVPVCELEPLGEGCYVYHHPNGRCSHYRDLRPEFSTLTEDHGTSSP